MNRQQQLQYAKAIAASRRRAGPAPPVGPADYTRYEDAVLADSPSYYWRLGRDSAAYAHPRSGNIIGTFENSPSPSFPGPIPDDTAMDFPSYNSGITFRSWEDGDIANMGSSDFTVEFWIYLRAYESYSSSLSMPIGCGSYAGAGYYVFVTGDGGVGLMTNQPGALQSSGTAAGAIPLRKWTHVMFTRSGSSVIPYVNGADASYTVGVHVDPTNASTPFTIGNYTSNADFAIRGAMSDVAVYYSCLTPARAKAHYDARYSDGMANPMLLPSGPPKLWLDGTDVATMFNAGLGGDLVTHAMSIYRWEDKSGNGYHAYPVGSTIPVLNVNGIGSEPAVVMDGAGGMAGSLGDDVEAMTTIVVVRIESQSSYDRIFSQSGAPGLDYNQSGHYIPLITGPSNNGEVGSFAGGSLPANVAFTAARTAILTSSHSGTVISNSIDGWSVVQAAHTLGANSHSYGVGIAPDGSGPLNGKVAQVLHFPYELSDADKLEVELYLARRLNIYHFARPVYPPSTYGPLLWLDGSDAATFLNGSFEPAVLNGSISWWMDKSGYGRNAFFVNGDAPTFTQNINGGSQLTFYNGTLSVSDPSEPDDSGSPVGSDFWAPTGECTIIVASYCNQSNFSATYNVVLGYGNASVGGSVILLYGQDSSIPQDAVAVSQYGNGFGSTYRVQMWNIQSVEKPADALKPWFQYVYGSSFASMIMDTNTAVGNNSFAIGSHASAMGYASPLDGTIAGVSIFSPPLTRAHRREVEFYYAMQLSIYL